MQTLIWDTIPIRYLLLGLWTQLDATEVLKLKSRKDQREKK